jgi:hypothetical protein
MGDGEEEEKEEGNDKPERLSVWGSSEYWSMS